MGWLKCTVLQDFCTAALPVLVQLLQTVVTSPSASPELASLMCTILKIFWSCIYIAIPMVMTKDLNQARAWLQVCPQVQDGHTLCHVEPIFQTKHVPSV